MFDLKTMFEVEHCTYSFLERVWDLTTASTESIPEEEIVGSINRFGQ